MITFGSLFSGIGGFDLGMERAGLQAIWQCENNKDCQRVLKRHWPNTRLYNDVKEINQSNTATPDVIVGGFPCQDLSVAGKREGLAGERSGLWFEFHRIIKELKPRWVVIENVPGLLSSKSGRDFAIILRGLAECGYYAAWRILDAQYFGVAQRRRRVFIVASLGNGSCAQVLFESEGGAWDSPPGRETGQRIAGTIAAGAHPGSYNGRDAERDMLIPFDTTQITSSQNRNKPQPGAPSHPLSSAAHPPAIAFQQNGRNEIYPINGNGQITGSLSAESGSKQQTYVVGSLTAHHGRNNPDSQPLIASTFNGYTGGADDNDAQGNHLVAYNWQSGGDTRLSFGLPNLQTNQVPAVGVRRLTPVECERLQGFPIQEECVIIDVCLDHQNNSASVEIQNHKSPKPAGIAERTGLLSVVRYAEPNLNQSDPSNSELARRTVLINCGENRVEILNQEKCFLSANFAEGRNLFPQLIRNEDFALLVAGLNSIAEQITLAGKEASPVSGLLLKVPQNGKLPVRLSGSETMQLVNDAIAGSITNKGLLKSITSNPSDIKISEPILITLFSSVLSAISGYIPSEILKSNSFRIEVNSSLGWTFPQSDSQRYRQLGNAVAVPCAEWIGRRIVATLKS